MDNKKSLTIAIKYFSSHYAFILLLFTLLLSSCSHIARHDGPPNFYVDETKIPDAVPKPEPLAKYGNMPSYVVFGKRYYTMRSSRHYEAVGTASWYGTQFHTHRTSSGEVYNMLGMTAAHKTLPLPTYVAVTNLKNGRQVIVKVNDRGPFESNRLIDLSYVAAKKLRMLGHGTTQVRVEAIDPYLYAQNHSSWPIFAASKPNHASPHVEKLLRQNTPIAKVTHYRHTHFIALKSETPHQVIYLQVGAFRNKLRAEKLQHHLMAILATPVKITHSTTKTNLYHVKVGPFKDIVTAERISYKLKGIGFKPNKIYGA
ncbi:MAG: septal ring lytic transglycosylase RlpA family protein [Gammaproteobacteria bacterium]|nr:septal ring lytic transglycosylase RlpA family protein [Gammaproteobacteria bacterium]